MLYSEVPLYRCLDGLFLTDLLESATFQPATVSGFGEEENMCQLSLEWSEAIVSCGGDVSYTVTVTPCLSGPGDCDVINGSPVSTFSTTDIHQTVTVNGSVTLKYSSTVTTETCDVRINNNPNYSVDLRGNWYCV